MAFTIARVAMPIAITSPPNIRRMLMLNPAPTIACLPPCAAASVASLQKGQANAVEVIASVSTAQMEAIERRIKLALYEFNAVWYSIR